MAWELTGKARYREIAVRLAWYCKNRIALGTDGASYWGYWLPLGPVSQDPMPPEDVRGLPEYPWVEDLSHAGLTTTFWILMTEKGEVFTRGDMTRLGRTVTEGFGWLDNGILFSDIVGNPVISLIPRVPSVTPMLRLSRFDPLVYDRLSDFYFHYWPSPGPLDNALIVRYRSIADRARAGRSGWRMY